jgi:signal transduction histidine kinase
MDEKQGWVMDTEDRWSSVDNQQLIHHIVEAQEEYRRRMARELHDEVGQSLAAALVQVETLEALLHDSPQVKPHLTRLRATLERLHEEVQRVVLDLRPTLLEQKGLMSALAWYAQERLGSQGVTVHLSGSLCAAGLPDKVCLALYRIGQEAISNVVRHAAARNVWLDLRCADATLVLSVRDDGRGFDVERVANTDQPLKGVGLVGIRERAKMLDGEATIVSASGAGALVEVRIPYTTANCAP